MASLEFFDEIPCDVPHTLHQLLSRFQSVESGLPELVKNAKDQYARLHVQEKHERAIAVLVNGRNHSIGVLDFAGAEADDFDRWKIWSDRSAALSDRARDIEGGHGNGGKAFMVRGSTTDSFFESCAHGHRTKMGFRNDDPDHEFVPGYHIEKRERIRNQMVRNTRPFLDRCLKGLGCDFAALPQLAKEAFSARDAFTLAQVNGVRDWDGRRPATVRKLVSDIRSSLINHPQAALSIESCSVWLVVDGVCIGGGPLERHHPEPMNGFEKPIRHEIPHRLRDPKTKEYLETREAEDRPEFLELRTSRRSLRMEDTRPLNVVRIRNDRNIVANWNVASLFPRAESAFIFGDVTIRALKGEHLSGSERESTAETVLVRAVRHWVSQQVQILAESIHRATATTHTAEDLDTVNDALGKFRQLMRQYLNLSTQGVEGTGRGSRGEGTEGSERTPTQRGAKVDELVLEGTATAVALAKGTTVPLVVRAYELTESDERRNVGKPAFKMYTDNEQVLSVRNDAAMIGKEAGFATIWCVAESGVESNRVVVEVVECSDLQVRTAPVQILKQGQRVSLRPVFDAVGGSRSDLLLEAGVDEPNMGSVSRHGLFTAGGHPGKATVRVRFGAEPEETVSTIIEVTEERLPAAPRRGKGGTEGGEIPLILLCGTEAPGMEQYPTEQRTHGGGEHFPTIIDFEPQFEHVVWLNPDSKEAIQARRGRGGRRGVAGLNTQTFAQFVALKCFEVLKRLRVRQDVGEGVMTEQQFRQYFAEAETDCARFIDSAYAIAREITEGVVGTPNEAE